MTMEFGTMSHRSSVLTMSLDRTLEAFTFGNSGCVDLVASCEDVSLDSPVPERTLTHSQIGTLLHISCKKRLPCRK